MEEVEEEKIYLIAGVINATGKMLFWKDNNYIAIGNYAIVENIKEYDLVKVVGRVETTKKEARRFANTRYEDIKETVVEISKEKIEEIKQQILINGGNENE